MESLRIPGGRTGAHAGRLAGAQGGGSVRGRTGAHSGGRERTRAGGRAGGRQRGDVVSEGKEKVWGLEVGLLPLFAIPLASLVPSLTSNETA